MFESFTVPARRGRRALAITFVAVALAGCSTPPASNGSSATPATGQDPALWGDMTPVVSVKELMHDMIDPASDFVFNSVGAVITHNTVVETEPKTQEDWDKVRAGAVMMAEGAYLLKIKRPFTPKGDNNNSEGPDAPELSPAQITAKVEKDPVLWNAKIEALRNVGKEVLEIVDKKDASQLWEAAENLDEACENCHLEYWYPNETALMSKLDRKLEELYGVRADRTGRKPLGMDPPKK